MAGAGFSAVVEYSTDGAPLWIGDVEQARHWSGAKPNGGPITIEYGGKGIETLPKEFAQSKKPGGKRVKKFTKLADADAFEAALLKLCLKLYPSAKRPSRYPDYCRWYVGTETADGVYSNQDAVFSIERGFTSDYSATMKKLAGDAAVIEFNKKREASALFFDVEGVGRGEIAVAPAGLAVARVITANAEPEGLVASLKPPSLKRGAATIELGAHVVVFNAARAGAEVTNGFTPAPGIRPVAVPDQRRPGGAFVTIAPGTYSYWIERDRHHDETTFDVLWIRKR